MTSAVDIAESKTPEMLKNVKAGYNQASEKFNEVVNGLKETNDIVNIIIIMSIGFILFVLLSYALNKLTLKNRNCKNIKKVYKNSTSIISIDKDDKVFSHNLRDYYIKTAYSCCCTGNYKNDYVDLCALENCIKQGVRCLDFEIYSYNNKPVIAASSVNSNSIKETYNYISFGKAMDMVANLAFSNSASPNAKDPLLLHFRIMSNNIKVYDIMANTLNSSLGERLLDNNFSYENGGKNLGATPIVDLLGKAIIIVDKSNKLFESTKLDEFVNMASNSMFMRMLRYNEVKFTHDMNELINYNKKNMTIVLPNLDADNANPDPSVTSNYGCQMNALAFQNFDKHMEYYSLYFDKKGSAFVLKPEHLRYTAPPATTITPANPEWSACPRPLGPAIAEISPDLAKHVSHLST